MKTKKLIVLIAAFCAAFACAAQAKQATSECRLEYNKASVDHPLSEKVKFCLDRPHLTPSASLISDFSGHFFNKFTNGDVAGDEFKSVDNLYIKFLDDKSVMNFQFETNFYNGHTCSGEGSGRYVGDDAFLVTGEQTVLDDNLKPTGQKDHYKMLIIKDKGDIAFKVIEGPSFQNFEDDKADTEGLRDFMTDKNPRAFFVSCGARGGIQDTRFSIKNKVIEKKN